MSGRNDESDNSLSHLTNNVSRMTERKSLISLRYRKNKKRVIPTSAMRINAYAIPLRERIVIISNRGRYFQKYVYKNLNVSSNSSELNEPRTEMAEKMSSEKGNRRNELHSIMGTKEKTQLTSIETPYLFSNNVSLDLENHEPNNENVKTQSISKMHVSKSTQTNCDNTMQRQADTLLNHVNQNHSCNVNKSTDTMDIHTNESTPMQIASCEKVLHLSIKSIWRKCLSEKNNETQEHVKQCETCSSLHSIMLSLSAKALTTEIYPNYNIAQQRYESFDDMDEDELFKIQEIVEQGFFYAQEGNIKCFSCGLTVEIRKITQQNYLKLHESSIMLCAHNVKKSIVMPMKNYCGSSNQPLQNKEEIYNLCKVILDLTANSHDFKASNLTKVKCELCKKTNDTVITCPWINIAKHFENKHYDIVEKVLNISKFTGLIRNQLFFLNCFLTYKETKLKIGDIVTLSENGFFCTDKNKLNFKCCGCDLEIANIERDDNNQKEINSWKIHKEQAKKFKNYEIKCSFLGIDLVCDDSEDLKNILNDLDSANWYLSNKYWRCKQCKSKQVSIGADIKHIILKKFKKLENNPNETSNRKADELQYMKEYEEQYKTNYSMSRYIKLLIKRRINFMGFYENEYSNIGTIYFQDEFKSQRLFDANYIFSTLTESSMPSNTEKCIDSFEKLFKYESKGTEFPYATCITVFGSTKNKYIENFFDLIMYIHNKLSPKKGIMFLTEGLNTPAMYMLGNVVYKRQTFSNNYQYQDKEATQRISPLAKIVGIVELDKNMCELIHEKENLFRPKRIEIEVTPYRVLLKNNDPNISNVDSKISLNPNHTDFIFIENENQASQLDYVLRYNMHEHIVNISCIENNRTPDQSRSNKFPWSLICPFIYRNKSINNSNRRTKKLKSLIILIGGDDSNENEKIIKEINNALSEAGHVIICKNTGRLADELSQIYNEQKCEQNTKHEKANSSDNTIKSAAKKTFRKHCSDIIQNKEADKITVIDFSLSLQIPNRLATEVYLVFFSLLQTELTSLNLLKLKDADKFKKKLRDQNVLNGIEIGNICEEITENNVMNIELENLLNNEVWEKTKEKVFDAVKMPFETLFIWATITGRDDLGNFFLKNCKNIIFMSLIAAYFYRLKRKLLPFYKTNSKRKLKQLKESYEDIARGIIDLAYVALNEKENLFFTIHKTYDFFDTNVIEVAAIAKCKAVLKTDAFGDMMDSMWHGDCKIAADSPFPRVINSYLRKKITSSQQQNADEMTLAGKFLSYIWYDVRSKHVAPKTKFKINLTFFVIFLLYYVVVLLLLYEGKSNVILEGIIFTWVVGILFEEIFEIVQVGSFQSYFSKSRYNIIDVFIILIGFAAFFTSMNKVGLFDFARYFYWFNGVLLIFRLFREFAAFKSLGPKLTMIFIMMKQLGEFSFILITVLTLFGISYSLFPSSNEEISFLKPFFLINQMIYDFEDISQAQQVCFSNYSNTSDVDTVDNSCAAFAFQFITSASFIYIVNLMVINYIIALFSSVYDTFALKSEQVWRLGFYRLMEKYTSSPILPSPFCIFEIIFYIIQFVNKSNQSDSKMKQTHGLFNEDDFYNEYLKLKKESEKTKS